MDNPYYTPCTRHSFPLSTVRETREGVPYRPQLPSGAVFSCCFTGGSIGPKTSLSWTPSTVCRCEGQQAWQVLSAGAQCSPCLRRLVLVLVSVV